MDGVLLLFLPGTDDDDLGEVESGQHVSHREQRGYMTLSYLCCLLGVSGISESSFLCDGVDSSELVASPYVLTSIQCLSS